MNSDKKKVVFLIVLGVICVAVLWWQLRPSGQEGRMPEQAAQSPQQTAQGPAAPGAPAASTVPARLAQAAAKGPKVDLDALLASVKEVDFFYTKDLPENKNPMRPLVGKVGPRVADAGGDEDKPADLRNMVVTGILYDKNNPMAIVNDQVVYRGFTFDATVVVEDIEPSRVLLRANDALYSIELEEQ